MKDVIRIGYIGLGRRGLDVLRACFSEMDDVEIGWICDFEEENLKKALAMLDEKGRPRPFSTTEYRKILEDESVDAVVIMTNWDTHVPLMMDSMRASKYTAVEVGGAYDLQQCYDLIHVYEETGSPLMMLENCCYGRREMMALNLVKKGLFGEIVHCKGGYLHYLNDMELFLNHNEDKPHYRINEYVSRNCENYPTHELGPISKVLGINRGNRYMKLTSVSSKSCGLREYAKKNLPEDSIYNRVRYKQGDIVNTCLTCANGETVLLTLDTTLPRPYYSRDFTVRGTKGMYTEERKVLFFEGMEEEIDNNEEEFFSQYDHPLQARYAGMEKKGGHGGIDWLVCRAFVESVKREINTPIDAYDTVTWMSITPLSEMSIQLGGAPVNVPDFTKGKWIRREPPVLQPYSLDVVCEPDSLMKY